MEKDIINKTYINIFYLEIPDYVMKLPKDEKDWLCDALLFHSILS